MDNHAFCRALLKTVRSYLTNEQRKKLKGAWVWRDGNRHAEFHVPNDDFYWYGAADCAYDAKQQGISAWLQRNYPEQQNVEEIER